jgi:hypothetical protein
MAGKSLTASDVTANAKQVSVVHAAGADKKAEEEKPRDYVEDAMEVGRRVLFGATVSGSTCLYVCMSACMCAYMSACLLLTCLLPACLHVADQYTDIPIYRSFISYLIISRALLSPRSVAPSRERRSASWS